MKTDNYIQIEVLQINQAKEVAKCILFTPEGSATIYMKKSEYEHLQRNGFFIKDFTDVTDGQTLNITLPYYQKTNEA
jgi:hypothetical protein